MVLAGSARTWIDISRDIPSRGMFLNLCLLFFAVWAIPITRLQQGTLAGMSAGLRLVVLGPIVLALLNLLARAYF